MISQEIASSWSSVGLVVVSSVAMLAAIVVYVRVNGLRSFSKMSAFDFSVTLAFGSILAAVSLSSSSLVDGLVAGATLLGAQSAVAWGRSRLGLSAVVDNEPRLLMVGPDMLIDNLRQARVTPDDVRAKLRAANAVDYRQIRAVVLETTGDISVLYGPGPVTADLVADIPGADAVATT